jgi:type III secretory pathway component EscT
LERHPGGAQPAEVQRRRGPSCNHVLFNKKGERKMFWILIGILLVGFVLGYLLAVVLFRMKLHNFLLENKRPVKLREKLRNEFIID